MRKSLSIFFAIALVSFSFATPANAAANSKSWTANLTKISSGTKGVSISGLLIDQASGKILWDRSSQSMVPPASTLKLFTIAAALDKLGFNFRTSTEARAYSSPDNQGVINGDLIIYGKGDPGLTSYGPNQNSLAALADKISALGVKRISGGIIGDRTFFRSDLIPPGRIEDDLNQLYGTEVSSLSVDNNLGTVKVSPAAKIGELASYSVAPVNNLAIVNNRVFTGKKGSGLKIVLKKVPGQNLFELTGTIPLESQPKFYSFNMHDPALWSAAVMKELLISRGIIVEGPVSSFGHESIVPTFAPLPPQIKITEVHSLTVLDWIKQIGKNSNNLYAEILLRQLGVNSDSATNFSDLDGLEQIKKYLSTAGIGTDNFRINDGSGLSRDNLIPPATTAALLEYVQAQPYGYYFFDSLPIGGKDGTLKSRFKSGKTINNVVAKTGTLETTFALAGIVKDKASNPMVFAIVAKSKNSYLATQTIDKLVSFLATSNKP